MVIPVKALEDIVADDFKRFRENTTQIGPERIANTSRVATIRDGDLTNLCTATGTTRELAEQYINKALQRPNICY